MHVALDPVPEHARDARGRAVPLAQRRVDHAKVNDRDLRVEPGLELRLDLPLPRHRKETDAEDQRAELRVDVARDQKPASGRAHRGIEQRHAVAIDAVGEHARGLVGIAEGAAHEQLAHEREIEREGNPHLARGRGRGGEQREQESEDPTHRRRQGTLSCTERRTMNLFCYGSLEFPAGDARGHGSHVRGRARLASRLRAPSRARRRVPGPGARAGRAHRGHALPRPRRRIERRARPLRGRLLRAPDSRSRASATAGARPRTSTSSCRLAARSSRASRGTRRASAASISRPSCAGCV